jgi:hypothetical protein
MTRMLDSTTPRAIPADTPVVAGYIDGLYKWPAAEWLRFTGQLVSITVRGALSALVYDIESGDGTPAQGAAWCRTEILAGRRPTLYSSRSTHAELVKLIDPAAFDWWAADPTGVDHLLPGSVATQWAWEPTVDISTTNGVWPARIAPGPAPLPSAPTKEQMMTAVVVNGVPTCYAASPQGHLLQFSLEPGGWSVIDVTAAIEAAHPGLPPYLVQP